MCTENNESKAIRYKEVRFIHWYILPSSRIKLADNWHFLWALLGIILTYISTHVTLVINEWLKLVSRPLGDTIVVRPPAKYSWGRKPEAPLQQMLSVKPRMLASKSGNYLELISHMALGARLYLKWLWQFVVYRWWGCLKHRGASYYLDGWYLLTLFACGFL